jgi:hypothetical protein
MERAGTTGTACRLKIQLSWEGLKSLSESAAAALIKSFSFPIWSFTNMLVQRLIDANGAMVTHANGTRPHPAGSPGAAVSTQIRLADRYGEGLLPDEGAFRVSVMPDQPAFVHVTEKSQARLCRHPHTAGRQRHC